MAIIRGSAFECMKHFGECIAGNFEFRRTICQILGINDATGHRWFDNLTMPGGVNLLKLFLLLDLNGYQVTEFQKIDAVVRLFGRFISLEIATGEEIVEWLEFADTDSLMRVLLGRCGTSNEKLEAMTQQYNLHEREILDKISAWKEKVVFKDEPLIAPAPEPEQQQIEDSVTHDTISHEDALRTLAYMTKAMLPLAELIGSDNFSVEERKFLRELSSDGRTNSVFELSNALNRLCSETARKDLK